MIPIGSSVRVFCRPWMTILILLSLVGVWILIQGAGLSPDLLAATICNLGLVPGEITARAVVGSGVPIGAGLQCIVDRDPINIFTPLTSMFLHGSWGHLIGNIVFLWVFGKCVEDSLGHGRYLVFYLLCGLAAAAMQVTVAPTSPVPMVGASGAISGLLGGFLVLYPRAKVRVLFILVIFIYIATVPAPLLLLWWVAWQLIAGLPQLMTVRTPVSVGVAVWAHVGGFAAGLLLVKFFADPAAVAAHNSPSASRRS